MKINIANVFDNTPISEGEHVFKVSDVKVNENFNSVSLVCKTKDGKTHFENYKFDKNPKSIYAFKALAQACLDGTNLVEIEPEELIGRYFKATVVHTVVPSTKNEGETFTFVNLFDKAPASGFDGETVEKPKSVDDVLKLFK